ncbi:HlyD family type I secretion periplasmic adaptor subunit [Ramlibacter sp. AN1015]|uniref:HlyD family type I secretion periplasmic adaptor subunit n=1 Tax=Ramlibacter sp. AN1015 TaxID=3133428 RepID=UPI0030C25812
MTTPFTPMPQEPFASMDQAPDTNAGRFGRWGWLLVLVGLGGFLLWAGLAPLDQGVPVTGTVTVSGNKKAVQHEIGGTVERILVQEGARVVAGQELVRMNSVHARSNADSTRVQYHTARSTEARLLAERDGRTAISFAADTQAAARSQPRVAAIMAVQQQLFSSRRFSLQAELSALDESIAGIEAHSAGLQAARSGKLDQQRLMKEHIDNLRELARDGYVPRNRLLELERGYAQLAASLSEDLGNIHRAQRQASEFKLRRLQRLQEYQMEVRTQLADVQKEADVLRSQLEGLEHQLATAVVRAPVSGIVADLSVFTEGGVVAPGLRMMDIVPLSEPLVVQAQLPVHLVDSVRPGLPLELIFSAFNQNVTPRVPGVVTEVSADRLVDDKSGSAYYRLEAHITEEGKRLLAQLPVRPGMPVDLFVKTGERTMANYLLRPLRDHLAMALTEE